MGPVCFQARGMEYTFHPEALGHDRQAVVTTAWLFPDSRPSVFISNRTTEEATVE